MPPEATPAAAPAPKAEPAKPAPAATPPAGGSGSHPAAQAGADSAAAAKPGDPPAPAKARDQATLAREAARFRQARREANSQVEAIKAEYETKFAETKRQLDTLASESKAWQEERQAFLADPIEWAQKHGGATAEKAIQSFVAKGTPEAAIAEAKREAAEAKAATEELKKLREQDKADRETERAESEKQARAAAESGACKAFARTITVEAKKYPYINALYSAEEIESKAAQFQQIAAKEEWTDEQGRKRVGKAYPFDEVAKAFEQGAKIAYDKRQARLAELTAPADGDPESASGIQMKPVPGNGRREGNRGPKTGAESPPKPKPSRILSRKEQEDADRAMLREAMRKDLEAAKPAAKH
jgi:colicin import membrane protein